jgi:hypothetical protein
MMSILTLMRLERQMLHTEQGMGKQRATVTNPWVRSGGHGRFLYSPYSFFVSLKLLQNESLKKIFFACL